MTIEIAVILILSGFCFGFFGDELIDRVIKRIKDRREAKKRQKRIIARRKMSVEEYRKEMIEYAQQISRELSKGEHKNV